MDLHQKRKDLNQEISHLKYHSSSPTNNNNNQCNQHLSNQLHIKKPILSNKLARLSISTVNFIRSIIILPEFNKTKFLIQDRIVGGRITLYDFIKMKPLKTWTTHFDNDKANITCSPILRLQDGNIICAFRDNAFKVLNLYIGGYKEIWNVGLGFNKYSSWELLIELQPRIIASANLTGDIFIWNLKEVNMDNLNGINNTNNKRYIKKIINQHHQPCFSIVGLIESKFAVGSYNEIHIHDYLNKAQNHEKTLKGHNGLIGSLCTSKDQLSIFSSSFDKTIKIWNWKKGICIRTIFDNQSVVNTVFLVNEMVLSSLNDMHNISFWNIKNGSRLDKAKIPKSVILFSLDTRKSSILLWLYSSSSFAHVYTLKGLENSSTN